MDNLIHFSIQFDTDSRNRNFLSKLTDLISGTLKTVKNLKMSSMDKEEYEKLKDGKPIIEESEPEKKPEAKEVWY